MTAQLTIGEVATRSGAATSALRFYESLGLIASTRTNGNQRRYDRAVLRRIAFIQAGRAAGVSLEQIGEVLATLPRGRAPNRRDWERLSRRWRDDLDQRIETLQALRDRLTSCIGCGCLSLRRCALVNKGDDAARRGPGAHFLLQDAD
jgi:MerR family redox-sensitive transcriptional activator SoxR